VPVKLPYVEYEAPTTVAEAVHLLAEHQDEASVLAGGQSLIPLLALRLAHPVVLIDINGVAGLSGVSATDGRVAIGAMTREYVAEESQTVADAVPLLAAALPMIGHEAIRSRGTIGGSLAHADPAAELPAVALALDAEFVVRSQSGERVIPAADWFEGYLTTSRLPDELLVEVRFPAARRGTGISFQEVARRHGDFAVVGLAASYALVSFLSFMSPTQNSPVIVPESMVIAVFFSARVYTDRLTSVGGYYSAYNFLNGQFWLMIICLLLASSAYNTAVYGYFRLYDEQRGVQPTLKQVGQLFVAKFFKVFFYNLVVTVLLVLVAIIPVIIVMFIPLLNVLAIILFIVIFAIILFYLNCIYVTEDLGLSGGISRLFYLFSNRWWHVIGFTLIVGLIYVVFAGALQLALGLIKEVYSISTVSTTRYSYSEDSGSFITVGMVLFGIVYLLQQLFYLIIFCSVGVNYYSLTEEKDGSAIEEQIDNIGGSTDKYSGVDEQY